MKLKVKDMDIATGDVEVVILNQDDAALLDLHHMDRILVKRGKKSATAVLDIAESKKAVPHGRIGLFEEVIDAIKAKHGDIIEISLAKKPKSIEGIRKKLDGKELNYDDTYSIVKDIVENKLTAVELTSYVIANYARGMSMDEIVNLTKAMTLTGTTLKIKKKKVFDLHSIGGVPGNRITMIVVPMMIAAGLIVPKTSSRAITSPAGTADTMDVLCDVTIPISKLSQMIKKIGGFIIWGGAVNLAPADDKIIKVEHPLSIDAEGQMIASIMAKKASVSATHVLMEIPYGKGTKVPDIESAKHLKHLFETVSSKIGILLEVMITEGTEPVGNGIGAALEARDCLWIFERDPRRPRDLEKKSIEVAATALEFAGMAKKGFGEMLAEEILTSGKASKIMLKIIKAQGGRCSHSEHVKFSKLSKDIFAEKTGSVTEINNLSISKIARLAGAPKDSRAGIYLYKHVGDSVKKGDVIYTIYAENKEKIAYSVAQSKETKPFTIR